MADWGKECSFDGCTEPAKTRGYCSGHAGQFYRGIELKPLRADRRRGKRCSFDGCKKPYHGGGYCNGHSWQLRNGRPLTPILVMATVRDDFGRKQCSKCSDWKSESSFPPNRAKRDGLNPYCRDCHNFGNRLRRHGITPDQYWSAMEDQCGRCAICGIDISTGSHIDHDHRCCPIGRSCGDCFRGLLCGDCNRVLGIFKDDPQRFKSAIFYLERAA